MILYYSPPRIVSTITLDERPMYQYRTAEYSHVLTTDSMSFNFAPLSGVRINMTIAYSNYLWCIALHCIALLHIHAHQQALRCLTPGQQRISLNRTENKRAVYQAAPTWSFYQVSDRRHGVERTVTWLLGMLISAALPSLPFTTSNRSRLLSHQEPRLEW